MKKLSTLLMAVIAMIAFAMPATAQTLSKAELAKVAQEINKTLPQDCGDGLVMSSCELAGDVFYFNFNTKESNEVIEFMNTMTDSLTEVMKKEFLSSPDIKIVVDTCRELKTNIVIRMYSKDKSTVAKFVLRWEDM